MIIAIDGASTDLSVAIADTAGGILEELAWTTPQRQSAELLPRLLELLDRTGRRLDEATAIGVGTGPGSFTGLRVAMALGKGLATACDIPIVGVPSLAAWLDAEPEADAALTRAGAREAYLLARGQAEVAIVDREALPAAVHDRTAVAPAEVARAFDLVDARQPRGAAPIARRTVSRLATDPGGDDVRLLEPIYLRAPRGVTDEGKGAVKWL